MNLLEIENLHASVNGTGILKGLSLNVGFGEVHAIMGPNGSGKSTLAQVLAGRDDYEITNGAIRLRGEDLTGMAPEERASAGLFLAFQYPIEIPGVNNTYLLKAALNAQRRSRGEPEVDAFEFMRLIKDKMKVMQISETFLNRSVNEGFSGGEKKRNEVLQMMMLEPVLCVMDETDSGLDVDALKIVASGINSLRDLQRSMILVTHYERLLELVQPDFVHVLSGGRILKSGDQSLARELDERGYDWVIEEARAG
jgi:Fe-S cluster assembly ATP-binding protein